MTSRSTNPLRTVFLWSLCLCCTSLLAASTALPSGASTSDGSSSSSSAINKPRTIGPGSTTSFDFAPRIPTPSLLPDDYKKLIPAWVKCSEITGITRRLEALPGTGWDNLDHTDKGYVIDLTYDQCKTTSDGKFLIPDQMTTIPLQRSEVQQFADLYSSYTDYQSSTAHSMSLDLQYKVVSGSFSGEYQNNKQHQVANRATTARVQVRHELYLVEVSPDARLAPALKSRLLNIAALLQNQYQDAAAYELSLIVRDYGTHMVRSVVAGGAFVNEDQIRDSYVKDVKEKGDKLRAEAAVSALEKIGFKLSVGYSHSSKSSSVEEFTSNVMQSVTRTFGGPPYRPNMTIDDWESGLLNSLVAIDRIGDPLEYVISSFTLAGLPTPTIQEITRGIAGAAGVYLLSNTYVGCPDPNSPNFDYQVNAGDKTLCQQTSHNYTFGGVFQNCTVIPNSYLGTEVKDICVDYVQMNPLSGGYSCPLGYSAILLHKGKHVAYWDKQVCGQERDRNCWFWNCYSRVCRQQYYSATAEYNVYWCVKPGKVSRASGYLFGGVYTATSPNPITRTRSCPKNFFPLRFGANMQVCVSGDTEGTLQGAVGFSGFFSCSAGNPLAIEDPADSNKSDILDIGYGRLTGMENWPKRCPRGYSRRLAAMDDSCEISYCVRAGAFDKPHPAPLRRPPYGISYPPIANESIDTDIIIGPGNRTWVRNHSTGDWKVDITMTMDPTESKGSMDHTMIAIIATCAVLTLLCLILIIVLCRLNKKMNAKRERGYASAQAVVSGSDRVEMSQNLLGDDGSSAFVRHRHVPIPPNPQPLS
ncbi:macrophage-expressed gene 1 protein-like [Sycon ciliatum]|uniref:macrophage-expressed gene 1 protein-like n=1 Tax=Sycon ciliatum TaxID=27933 RepID=UPI0031F6A4F3